MQNPSVLSRAVPRGRRALWLLTGAVMAGIISYVLKPGLPAHPDSSQYQAGQFSNTVTLP